MKLNDLNVMVITLFVMGVILSTSDTIYIYNQGLVGYLFMAFSLLLLLFGVLNEGDK